MEDLPEEEKILMMRKLFRRSSVSDTAIEGHLPAEKIGTILSSVGQTYDQAELKKFIEKLDPSNTGKLDYDAFAKICGKFLKDPAALIKSAQDKFSFKNLLRLNDFENP